MSTVLEASARATRAYTNETELIVELSDGRTLTVPLSWFPRLVYGTLAERAALRIVAGGAALHWPQLDEEVSVAGLLAGHKSAEGTSSLTHWMVEMDRRRLADQHGEPWGEEWPLPEASAGNG
ncbi:MAG: DUF2442 domain-containing protein [Bacteroidota bacterium]